jgi:hypothetical protein
LYTAHTQAYGLGVGVLLVTPDLVYLVSGATDSKLILWQWSTMSLTQVKVFTVSGQIFSGAFLASDYAGIYNSFDQMILI